MCMGGVCKDRNTAYIEDTSRSITERLYRHWGEYNDTTPSLTLYQYDKNKMAATWV